MASPRGATYGAFLLNDRPQPLRIVASDAEYGGWEHVSVSLPNRCPNWPEMAHVKGLFWADDEAVVQYHPPREVYVNLHPYCLHLWKPTALQIPLPPSWMVGPRDGQSVADALREGEIMLRAGT